MSNNILTKIIKERIKTIPKKEKNRVVPATHKYCCFAEQEHSCGGCCCTSQVSAASLGSIYVCNSCWGSLSFDNNSKRRWTKAWFARIIRVIKYRLKELTKPVDW